MWVVDKLLLEHVELPHDLDLAVHLVHSCHRHRLPLTLYSLILVTGLSCLRRPSREDPRLEGEPLVLCLEQLVEAGEEWDSEMWPSRCYSQLTLADRECGHQLGHRDPHPARGPRGHEGGQHRGQQARVHLPLPRLCDLSMVSRGD